VNSIRPRWRRLASIRPLARSYAGSERAELLRSFAFGVDAFLTSATTKKEIEKV
jgi:hypothetical protein